MQKRKDEYVDISDSFKADDKEDNYNKKYAEEVSFSSKKPEMPKKKNNGIKKLCIISAVFVLLCGSVAVAAMSGLLRSPDTEADTKKSESSVVSTNVKEDKNSKEESVEEESSGLSYEPTGSFSINNKALSKSAVEEINERVTAGYVVLYDATADEIIFQRDGNEKCYPASTTKMLTAIVASKIIPKDTVITVGDEIEMINFDSSTAGLQIGMKMTYEALLDALLLPSGNDAAYTVAVNAARIYTGNNKLSNEKAVETFMELVNEAAKGIGCTKTHFVTPDGWHDDDHYTTAADLARIAAYARTIPVIKASCGKSEAEWDLIQDSSNNSSELSDKSDTADDESAEEETSLPSSMFWYNSNAMLQEGNENYSKYCDGMKTGFTDEAGTSVVASAEMNGHTFIAVVMYGESLYKKYEDANILFTEGFKLYDLEYTYGIE